jgi:hypothetical protein
MFWAAIVHATPMANTTALVIWRELTTIERVDLQDQYRSQCQRSKKTKRPANHRHGT